VQKAPIKTGLTVTTVLIAGLSLAACSASTPTASSHAAPKAICPTIGGATAFQSSKSQLAIVGVARHDKVSAAFQVVERMSLTNQGGCFINIRYHDQTIDVFSYPPTTAAQIETFARKLRASGEFASVTAR
jgi:hypothetical protein